MMLLLVASLVTATGRRGHFNLQRFEREKPENNYRIFCLGGSTTYGRPYDDRTSFCGWLRRLLPRRLAGPRPFYVKSRWP